jgi:hypothetical protein
MGWVVKSWHADAFAPLVGAQAQEAARRVVLRAERDARRRERVAARETADARACLDVLEGLGMEIRRRLREQREALTALTARRVAVAAETAPAPVAEVEPAPAVEVEPPPAAEVEPAPAAEVEPAPAAEVEPAPAADVEPAPARRGRTRPRAGRATLRESPLTELFRATSAS